MNTFKFITASGTSSASVDIIDGGPFLLQENNEPATDESLKTLAPHYCPVRGNGGGFRKVEISSYKDRVIVAKP